MDEGEEREETGKRGEEGEKQLRVVEKHNDHCHIVS